MMKVKNINIKIIFSISIIICLLIYLTANFWQINKELKITLAENEDQIVSLKKKMLEINLNMEKSYQESSSNNKVELNIGIPKVSELYGKAVIIKDESIKLYPSESSPGIGKISKVNIEGVIVYSEIISNGYKWVLVNSEGCIGYVHYDSLSPYSNLFAVDEVTTDIDIEGVSLGDYIGEAINAFGDKYLLTNEEYGSAIVFPENEVRDDDGYILGVDSYCTVAFDLASKRIRSIMISKEGYSLESGIQVGSNIKEAIDYYGSQQIIKKNDHYSYQMDINKFDMLMFNVTEEGEIRKILLTKKKYYFPF